MQQNICEIKVSYSSKVKFSESKAISSSGEALEILRSFWNKDTIELKEEFFILLLTRANKLKGFYKVSEGGVAGTVVDPKIVFSVALKCNASAIILAHNHPSGSTKPSQSDIELTKKIKEGGRLLEISVLDHIIITIDGFYSFADEGMI